MTWTLDRIYSRCTDDEGDGCRLWQGGMSKRYPICQEPAPERSHGQRQVHVRRLVWQLAKGAPAPVGPKWVLMASCRDDRCVADAHLVLLTKAKRLRMEAEENGRSLAYRAAVAAGRRRNSDLTDADVAAIRASTDPLEA